MNLKKDIGFKIVFCLYILLLLADLTSTLLLREYLPYLESNPLFKYGGLTLIMVLNIAIAAVFFVVYKAGKPNTRFIVMFMVIALCMTRIIAVQQNIDIYQHPPSLEAVKAIPEAELTQMRQETVRNLVALNILPLFNGLFAWFFFAFDHKISKNERNLE